MMGLLGNQASFVVEIIDGLRIGKLTVSLDHVADWITFLATPHYGVDIIAAEQGIDQVSIYFEANEGLYGYLEMRLGIAMLVA